MHIRMIAIIGRPNVGKSTLFNALIGRKIAIVHDDPGVTRDRVFHRLPVDKGTAMLVDTGGILTDPRSGVELGIRDQTLLACDEAHLVLFVVDGRVPPPEEDEHIARLLQKKKARVIVVANKLDSEKDDDIGLLYVKLGLGRPEMISALRRRHLSKLKARISVELPEPIPETRHAAGPAIAIIGKPNVGKSSLLNKLVGDARALVDATPGTTRDAVDMPVVLSGKSFLLIDTAGIRRKSHHHIGVGYYSYLRALKALNRCDVATLVLDAADTELEVVEIRLAHQAVQNAKAVLVVVNKWDTVTGDGERERWLAMLRRRLGFLGRIEPRFISAKTGRGVSGLPERMVELATKRVEIFAPVRLAAVLAKILAKNSPPSYKGREVRIYRIAQQEARFPKFVIYTNNPNSVSEGYARYLRNSIRDELGLQGVGFDMYVRQARSLN